MKTIATSIVLIFIILGCASNQPRVQYSLYQPIAGEIAPEKIQTELSNGVLTVDGQRVLDEEGWRIAIFSLTNVNKPS
ncbi:hypothetical protein PN36_22630 [Candidatus Thiomargarita nelsonii]|uniref:Uncharacterized protein n=1 Tax=Candidatus Thiomargarita nelsonii TaxID=1003181 RepID=A0A0A6PCR9_9GAMM|nr:hypothetical protein PN36_22630 [Candidatus Thiomargarita nelsonii]